MKQLFLLSLFITILSSCHEPYFENAFTEGEKIEQFPVEMQGKFIVINRYLEGDDFAEYAIDTSEDSLLVSSRRAGFTNDYKDTIELIRPDATDVINIDSVELRLYKGVYYLNAPVYNPSKNRTYFKIGQFKPTPAGMQYKTINYDYEWLVKKMKAKLEFKEEFYEKDECFYGCTIGVFKHNHADLHEFFETEIPDSLSTLLVRVH